MKSRTLLLALCCFAITGLSQGIDNYYRQLAERNLKLLTQSHTLLNRVKITDYGIELFTSGNDRRVDFRVFWNEVDNLVNLMETQDRIALRRLVNQKRGSRFSKTADLPNPVVANPFPTSLKGLRVALDPGHFGRNLFEGRFEGRVVNVHGSELGLKEDVHFWEADLTYMTCLLLKQKLDSAGAIVLITRPYGAGALGKGFKEWVRSDAFQDIETAYKDGEIKSPFYDTLRRAIADTVRSSSKYYLFQLYKFKDFIARSSAINAFHPDVSFVLHYNIREDNRASEAGRFIHPVQDNYSMAFVAGSFGFDELEKEDQKLDFIRLLLSRDLASSVRLADNVLQQHHRILQVPPIPFDSLKRLKNVVLPTEKRGVFARNLYLTRSIRGPLVYGESLYQDNVTELKALSTLDYPVVDHATGQTYKTSSRCHSVATAYFQGLLMYLTENRELRKEYEAALSDLE